MKKYKLTEQEIEFLKESNAIEREYSEIALEDAVDAWGYAKSIKFDIPHNVTKEDILKIHEPLMKRLNSEIAGKFREEPVFVGNHSQGFREGLDYKKISCELDKLLNPKLNPYYKGEEYIKSWHIQFEHIHPFLDGNGRTGRILMNIQRLKIGLPLLIIHEGLEQHRYYKWFKQEVHPN